MAIKASLGKHATLGEYVAAWTAGGQPRHARFNLERGPGGATIAAGG